MDKENLETIKKLTQLSALQQQAAILESEANMNRLAQAFTSLIEIEKSITENINNHEMLVALTQQLKSLIVNTTMELQFFDRLKQKLQHANEPLTAWTEHGLIPNPHGEEFIQNYSTEEERFLYKNFIANGDVHQTLIAFQSFNNTEQVDDELF